MSSESIDELIAAVRREADAAEFPIDAPVYHRAGRDPKDPILFAGSLAAPLCIVGRDLGKDEVATGQPLIGAAGRLVRLGVLKAWGDPKAAETQPSDGPPLQEALEYVVLTNTVPYKPPGNKAYAESVRRRFRPFLERLLTRHWQGQHLITLGSEAFGWFEPYIDPAVYIVRGQTEAPIRVGVPLPAPSRSIGPGHIQGDHRLPLASPFTPQSSLVRQVPGHAGRPFDRSP